MGVEQRIRRGEPLLAGDVKRLRDAISPKRGRRRRDPLKLVTDELARAFSFALARIDGKSYDDARDDAATATFTTIRSINRSFLWLEKTVGINRKALETLIRRDRELGALVRKEGCEAITLRDILITKALQATTAAFQAEFTPEEQAELLIDGSSLDAGTETIDRARDALREIVGISQSGVVLPFPVETHGDFAYLVECLALPIAQSIATRIRGCINSGEI